MSSLLQNVLLKGFQIPPKRAIETEGSVKGLRKTSPSTSTSASRDGSRRQSLAGTSSPTRSRSNSGARNVQNVIPSPSTSRKNSKASSPLQTPRRTSKENTPRQSPSRKNSTVKDTSPSRRSSIKQASPPVYLGARPVGHSGTIKPKQEHFQELDQAILSYALHTAPRKKIDAPQKPTYNLNELIQMVKIQQMKNIKNYQTKNVRKPKQDVAPLTSREGRMSVKPHMDNLPLTARKEHNVEPFFPRPALKRNAFEDSSSSLIFEDDLFDDSVSQIGPVDFSKFSSGCESFVSTPTSSIVTPLTKKQSKGSNKPVNANIPMVSQNLVRAFQKQTETRKSMKGQPHFEEHLFQFEKLLLSDEIPVSKIEIYEKEKKKKPLYIPKKNRALNQVENALLNSNIGKEYAKGLDTKSFILMCDIKRKQRRLDSILQSVVKESVDESLEYKRKVEKNFNLMRSSLEQILLTSDKNKKFLLPMNNEENDEVIYYEEEEIEQ